MKEDYEIVYEFYIAQGGKLHDADKHFFESDWNLLHEVVGQISKFWLILEEAREVTDCKIVIGTKPLYDKVVKFIKFYNENIKDS